MAERLLRSAAAEAKICLDIESAGVAALPDAPATLEAVAALQAHGIDASDHRARQLTRAMTDAADVILTMTRRHKDQVLDSFPSAVSKVHTVGEFIGEADLEVPDPYGRPALVYQEAAQRLATITARVLAALTKAVGQDTGADGAEQEGDIHGH